MLDWLTISIIVIALVLIIGNFSTFQKSAKVPMRKTGLNDLKETIERPKKSAHKMPTIKSNSKNNTSK